MYQTWVSQSPLCILVFQNILAYYAHLCTQAGLKLTNRWLSTLRLSAIFSLWPRLTGLRHSCIELCRSFWDMSCSCQPCVRLLPAFVTWHWRRSRILWIAFWYGSFARYVGANFPACILTYVGTSSVLKWRVMSVHVCWCMFFCETRRRPWACQPCEAHQIIMHVSCLCICLALVCHTAKAQAHVHICWAKY